MTTTHFANYRNTHHLYANEDGFDLDFIEAAHYDRERAYTLDSPVQAPIGGGSIIEHYAPADVTVLALPTLYCMGHAVDHPCAYTHKIAADMGVCDLELVKDAERYVPSERVQIVAERTYTGRIQRKA
jgi:hypothetical protein